MQADPRCVLTGTHFINGDAACCEGAIAAGARFAAGYPITPSTEIVERFAARAPQVGGLFIQMEDELASSIARTVALGGMAGAREAAHPGRRSGHREIDDRVQARRRHHGRSILARRQARADRERADLVR